MNLDIKLFCCAQDLIKTKMRLMRKAKKLLMDGEKELLLKQHCSPLKFHEAPGGCAYERHNPRPDWLLDSWHPLEKAQYPEYFALRDIRKREFIERWEKKYGKPDPEELIQAEIEP